MFKYLNKRISTPIAISIIVLIAVIVGGGILAYQYWWLPKEEAKNVACTMEAKLCPDGSAVGRTGPNCEFAECPTVKADETADWNTYRNEEYGFEIKYPNDTKLGDIDINGGREVWFQLPFSVGETNLGGKILHIRMVTTQFNNGVEQPATCTSNSGTSDVVINGITFKKNDISGQFGGTESASVAIEYCTMKGNKAFKLVSELNYSRYSQLPKFDTEKESQIFNQMLSTFRFIEEECAGEGELKCTVLGCTPCCSGLVDRYVKNPMRTESNEVICIEEMTMIRCVKCRDEICGSRENWCICPEDCPKPNPENLELSF